MVTFTSCSTPKSGSWTQLCDGIWWVRMPLPFELDHINLYVLDAAEGFFIVDTGVSSEPGKAMWRAIIHTFNKPLLGVIVTHMHPDHCGLAGWLCRHFNVPLYMNDLEYYVARSQFCPNPNADLTPKKRYFERAGVATAIIEQHVQQRTDYAKGVEPLPLTFSCLQQGQTFEAGGRAWEIMTFGGHSPAHVCLYNAEDKLLIGGDQVLPKISPNIGVYSEQPDANPLADYLASLDVLASLHRDTLVMPSHNVPYTGLAHRVTALRNHHKHQLDLLWQFCDEPRTLSACLPIMYQRELNGDHVFFAVAECLAHLNYLLANHTLCRFENTEGVYIYQRVI